MTEEERVKQERQKEWVKTRINCTLQAVFDQLASTIKHDVKIYNDSVTNACIEADLMTDNEPRIFVRAIQQHGDGDYVVVKLVGTRIQVKHRDTQAFTVAPQWDEDALECKLLINEAPEQYTYPQISQKAIGGLLFKPPIYPSSL